MTNKIAEITIDQSLLIRSEKYTRERNRAVTDILENNSFSVSDIKGPYSINIEVIDNKVVMSLDESNKINISLSPLRRIIKDYAIICESYTHAINSADGKKIETIDMGRRGVHNEGAEIIEDLLDGKAEIDFETSRKLFTLIYFLQLK